MGLCSCVASCLASGVKHCSLLVIEWSWVLALRWRSLGDFHSLILCGAGRSLVDHFPELGSPTSEAQPWRLAGASRACHPHGSGTRWPSLVSHQHDLRHKPSFSILSLSYLLKQLAHSPQDCHVFGCWGPSRAGSLSECCPPLGLRGSSVMAEGRDPEPGVPALQKHGLHSMFGFIRNCQNYCTILHSHHQQCTKDAVAPRHQQHLLLTVFFTLIILIGMQLYLIVILIYQKFLCFSWKHYVIFPSLVC